MASGAGLKGSEPPERAFLPEGPLERAFREQWSAIVAALARRTGDLQVAEDATAEAFATAARTWQRDGPPPNPGGWLMTTAWRRALDQIRRDRTVPVDAHLLGDLAEHDSREHDSREHDPQEHDKQEQADQRLGMIVACCHPALAIEARVALTLRYVAGLTTAQAAAGFLVPEPTMAQRLVRAKRKIREAGIRFDVPHAIENRLDDIRTVVYLIFNEGYSASGGDQLIQAELCEEAIWLGRLLHRLLPADAETAGLLALMLLHHSRSRARVDEQGNPVLLADQDRGRWDADLINEGTSVLDKAILHQRPGSFQIEAAIAALHAAAPSVAETDWAQIAALYGSLAKVAPSPVIEINRAVAVGMADGARAGLAVLAKVLAAGELKDYAPLHAAHAALLEQAGDLDAADAAWAKAERATHNAAVRAEIRRRRRRTHVDNGPSRA